VRAAARGAGEEVSATVSSGASPELRKIAILASGLVQEITTGMTGNSIGVLQRGIEDCRRREAARSDGEAVRAREAREGKKERRVRTLTPPRCSGGARLTAGSGEAAARRAPELWQRRRRWRLGVLGFVAEAAAAS
jgi:hypothetical protein